MIRYLVALALFLAPVFAPAAAVDRPVLLGDEEQVVISKSASAEKPISMKEVQEHIQQIHESFAKEIEDNIAPFVQQQMVIAQSDLKEQQKELDEAEIQVQEARETLEKARKEYEQTIQKIEQEFGEGFKDRSLPASPGTGMMGMPGMTPGMMAGSPQNEDPEFLRAMGYLRKIGPEIGQMFSLADEDWEVRFYDCEQTFEPFLPLLESMLPAGSKISAHLERSLVAAFTSPEGHERAGRFFEELEQKSQSRSTRTRLSSTRRISSRRAQSVVLEILLLQGNSDDGSKRGEREFSPDASQMGLEPEDLAFLGKRSWQTYDKAYVRSGDSLRFRTSLGDKTLDGEVEVLDGDRVKLEMDLQASGSRSVSSTALLNSGQTTLVTSYSAEQTAGSIVVAVRATVEEQPQELGEGFDKIIPALHYSNVDIQKVLPLISEISGVKIVADSDVTGKVTLSLSDVPLSFALNALCSKHNLSYYVSSDGTVHISKE